MTRLIDKLKGYSLFSEINRLIKSRMQERTSNCDTIRYGKILNKGHGRILPVEELRNAILQNRGWTLSHAPKPKGELNIYVVSSLTDWEAVLPRALEAFGNVNTFMWESGLPVHDRRDWVSWKNEGNRKILQSFHDSHMRQPIDVVVGYMTDYDTIPETILEIKRSGAIVVNMCFDDKLYYSGSHKGCSLGVKALAPVVDLNLTNSPESVVKYTASRGLAMFWPEAAHPDVHKPHDLPFEFDVSFVGKKYGPRPGFVMALKKEGIPVACFGPGWDSGPLSGEGMVKLYSRSRINLGFAGVGHSQRLMCLKGRDFEVPMSGGLYLTQANPELSMVYEAGREIVTYEHVDDCARKIEWLLANPGEAAGIRKSGRRRALSDHTWGKRFDDLFRVIGIMK
jgi:spore maturation protein CgeB